MRKSLVLVSFLLVCAALAGAACTSTASSAPSVRSSAVTQLTVASSTPLASLALNDKDVPSGYVLAESRAKNRTEVGELAISQGWQEGYVVRYTSPPGELKNTTGIIQTITPYPEQNIPGIIGLISTQEQSGKDMTFTVITATGIGDTSGGFVGRANKDTTVGQAKTDDPLSANFLSGGTTHTGSGQDVAEVYFARGGILEVIRVTGNGANAATVTELARKAAARIP
jgi:hypothetical protein